MLPKLIRLPLTVTYDSDDYTLTVTPKEDARLGAVMVSVPEFAALRDHEVTLMEHHRGRYVTKHTVNSTDYGVPLGSIAGCFTPSVLDASGPRVLPFKPWPGPINNLADFGMLQAMHARKQPLTLHEQFRLGNYGRFPIQNFSMIRLHPNHEFKIAGSRILAGTTITRAYLWCVQLEDADYDLFERQDNADYLDAPHWFTHALILAAAAGVDEKSERQFNPAIPANLGLQVLTTMAMAHSQNAGATYDETYLSAVLASWHGKDQEDLFPKWAAQRQLLTEVTHQTIQEYDPARRLGLWLPYNSRYYVGTQRLTTAQQKDVRLTQYGLLKNSNADGQMVGESPLCVC